MKSTGDPFAILVVDKPSGPTSHDVVNRIRKAAALRKVGHSGTLDPLASGVLVLLLGPATRLSEYLAGSDKVYRAVVRFGRVTDTYDAAGETVQESSESPSRAEVEAALPEFVGDQFQMPPAYSAVKVAGRKAYELARAGQKPELRPRSITVHSIELDNYTPPDLTLEIRCSGGTYVRSLAHELGQHTGTGAHLAELRRLEAGVFSLEQARSLKDLEEAIERGSWLEMLIPPQEALPHLPQVVVGPADLSRLRHGRGIAVTEQSEGMALALDEDGNMIAILTAGSKPKSWRPRKVFVR